MLGLNPKVLEIFDRKLKEGQQWSHAGGGEAAVHLDDVVEEK